MAKKIVQILQSKLKTTKSSGYDEISMFAVAVKKLRHVIAKWLKRVWILSFETGVYPKMWKLAKIVPMPIDKGGDEHVMKQHRPVALLPVLSKVIEKAMVNQLTSHIEELGEFKDELPNKHLATD